VGIWGYGGGSDFQGYDFVQTDEPADPVEGQTWYDVDADSAFVYDGTAWVEMTVTDHGQLSGITVDQHHAKPTSTQGSGGYEYTNTAKANWGISGQISNVNDGSTGSASATGDTFYTHKYRVHMDDQSYSDIHYVDLRDEDGNWHTIATSGGTWDETPGYYVTGIRAKASNNHDSWHIDYNFWVRPYLLRPTTHAHNI